MDHNPSVTFLPVKVYIFDRVIKNISLNGYGYTLNLHINENRVINVKMVEANVFIHKFWYVSNTELRRKMFTVIPYLLHVIWFI